METKDVLKYLWKCFSYIIVAYGYYLLYTFCLDTFYRFYSYTKSQYFAMFVTLIAISIGFGIWFLGKKKEQ
jgi:hypothetical protein